MWLLLLRIAIYWNCIQTIDHSIHYRILKAFSLKKYTYFALVVVLYTTRNLIQLIEFCILDNISNYWKYLNKCLVQYCTKNKESLSCHKYPAVLRIIIKDEDNWYILIINLHYIALQDWFYLWEKSKYEYVIIWSRISLVNPSRAIRKICDKPFMSVAVNWHQIDKMTTGSVDTSSGQTSATCPKTYMSTKNNDQTRRSLNVSADGFTITRKRIASS